MVEQRIFYENGPSVKETNPVLINVETLKFNIRKKHAGIYANWH